MPALSILFLGRVAMVGRFAASARRTHDFGQRRAGRAALAVGHSVEPRPPSWMVKRGSFTEAQIIGTGGGS